MDTYSGIIQEMSNTGAQLVQAAHPDSKLIRQRDEMLTRELRALKKETKDRRDRLVLSIQVLQFTVDHIILQMYFYAHGEKGFGLGAALFCSLPKLHLGIFKFGSFFKEIFYILS